MTIKLKSMVSFAAEPIFFLGNFAITNAFLNTLLVDFILISIVILVNRKITLVPNFIQNVVETMIEGFYNLTQSVAGERASKIFPYFTTFFLFILIANWTGLIPGITTFGYHGEHHIIPFFRPATSDFNVTLGLALVSAVATHGMSINTLGVKEYLSRYFSLNPIFLFVGFLEIISEITKVISLSFRLFGNIFAGEIVLGTISSLFAFLFPVPFLMLETIVGLVQALVFAMLTMAFMTILTTPHTEGAKEVSH